MPEFELTGPDGASYRLEAPDERAALAAFRKFTGGKSADAAPKETPVSLTDVARSTATGVPIVGGLANVLNAATNATLAPIVEPFLEKGPETLDQPTWGERFRRSKELQEARDKKFAEEHPVVDIGAKIVGGVAGTLPAVLAAPKLMGAAGTLPQMVKYGAGSGAAISAADAAVRGEDVVKGTAIGAGFGAGAPLVARGIGKAVQALRPAAAPVPQAEATVGTTRVPLRPDQATGDVAAAAEAEATLRGARGDRAQAVGQEFDALQQSRLQQATDEIAASLDPTGTMPRTAPAEAGERVIDDLVAGEARRLAGEQNAAARAVAGGEQLRAGVGGQVDAAGQPIRTVEGAFDAGDVLGEGVRRARDAHRERTGALYEQVRDVEGEFDPAMVRGLSGDIRARLAAGDDPLFVDPQTASAGNKALGIMDELGGLGLFNNRAAAPVGPVGPVARAAREAVPEPPAPSEAEQALSELIAQGVNPVRARAAVASMEGGDRLGPSVLDPHDVAVANGTSVRVVPTVVEASALKTSADAGYDQALQPRNRARAASGMQVNDIARNLNPARLGVSSEADRGAPIVGGDRMVESGNGRVLAIRQAYAENGEAAKRYREWLRAQGVDVSQYREPVLVRERVTAMSPEERKAFTVAANQGATLSLSAQERALADARILNPDVLGLIREPGDLGAAANRDFVRAFMQSVPASERGALVTAGGELSAEGLTRVRNAVLGKAYGDSPILARMAESTSDDVRSISRGLMEAAPEWAQLRARIAAGEVPAGMDITGDLVDAVQRTARIRSRGQGLDDAMAQTDAFGQQSPSSQTLQRLFYDADGRKAASSAQIGQALRHYAQEAAKVDAAPGLALGLPEVSAADVLKNTAARAGAPTAIAQDVLEAAAPAASGPPIGAVGLREMDQARKRLVRLYTDAKSAAFGPNGSPNDMRVMARILSEFDNAIVDAFEAGRFSGDSEVAARLLRDARASHALYRERFTSRGPHDEIGRDVEKILGRYTDTRSTPEEIATLSYGSEANPGGSKAVRIAQRLRTIFGEASPEWGAYKEGLIARVLDTPAGQAPRSPAATADRIDKFLDGNHGRVLSSVVLSDTERAALRTHAANLRAAEPADLSKLTSAEKIIARISGRDSGRPMSATDVADLLFGKTGRGDSGLRQQVAATLKRDLTPEGWTAVRQGMWQKLNSRGEGMKEFGPEALSTRLHEFLNGGLSKVLYSPAELAEMKKLANIYKQMIPPKGTTNPSGTAWALNRMAQAANSQIMSILGAVHSGFVGAGVGYGATKAAKALIDRRHGAQATRTFYGAQPKRPVRSSRVPIVLSQAAAPLVAN